jgi:hypothetical protein
MQSENDPAARADVSAEQSKLPKKRPPYTTLADEQRWLRERRQAREEAIATLEERPLRPTRVEPIYEPRFDPIAEGLARRGLMSYEAMHDLGPQTSDDVCRPSDRYDKTYKVPSLGGGAGTMEPHIAEAIATTKASIERKARIREQARGACQSVTLTRDQAARLVLRLDLDVLTNSLERIDRQFRLHGRNPLRRRAAARQLEEVHSELTVLEARVRYRELYELVQRLAPSKPLTRRAHKRCAIEVEIRRDPERSDREIARVVARKFAKCDHKTVGAVRRELEGEALTTAQVTEIKQHIDKRHDELAKLIVGTATAGEGSPVEAAEEILADRVSPLERPQRPDFGRK